MSDKVHETRDDGITHEDGIRKELEKASADRLDEVHSDTISSQHPQNSTNMVSVAPDETEEPKTEPKNKPSNLEEEADEDQVQEEPKVGYVYSYVRRIPEGTSHTDPIEDEDVESGRSDTSEFTERVEALLSIEFPELREPGMTQPDIWMDLDGQTGSVGDLNGQTNIPVDLDGQVYTSVDLDGQVYTSVDLDGQAYTSEDLDGHAYTPVDLDEQVDAPADLEGQADAPADLKGLVNAPADLEGQVDTSVDLDERTGAHVSLNEPNGAPVNWGQLSGSSLIKPSAFSLPQHKFRDETNFTVRSVEEKSEEKIVKQMPQYQQESSSNEPTFPPNEFVDGKYSLALTSKGESVESTDERQSIHCQVPEDCQEPSNNPDILKSHLGKSLMNVEAAINIMKKNKRKLLTHADKLQAEIDQISKHYSYLKSVHEFGHTVSDKVLPDPLSEKKEQADQINNQKVKEKQANLIKSTNQKLEEPKTNSKQTEPPTLDNRHKSSTRSRLSGKFIPKLPPKDSTQAVNKDSKNVPTSSNKENQSKMGLKFSGLKNKTAKPLQKISNALNSAESRVARSNSRGTIDRNKPPVQRSPASRPAAAAAAAAAAASEAGVGRGTVKKEPVLPKSSNLKGFKH